MSKENIFHYIFDLFLDSYFSHGFSDMNNIIFVFDFEYVFVALGCFNVFLYLWGIFENRREYYFL